MRKIEKQKWLKITNVGMMCVCVFVKLGISRESRIYGVEFF